ncbi:iron chelate uptake ABC transporter family permease subunit, partial [Actinomyces oris]
MSPRNPVAAWGHRLRRPGLSLLIGGLLLLLVLGLASVCIGVADFDPVDLVRSGSQGRSLRLFLVSRVPRTLAAVLAGSGIAVAGAVMQMSVRNRFVSPTTAGTTQFAVVGLLLVALFAPSASVVAKMMVASACAVAGSAVFLWLLRLLPHRRTSDDVTVPLIGLMLGGVVGAGTTFVAWRYDLLQSLGA